jgi:hypothetical protein
MLAKNVKRFIPNLAYPDLQWQPGELNIELVEDFDKGSVNYIA